MASTERLDVLMRAADVLHADGHSAWVERQHMSLLTLSQPVVGLWTSAPCVLVGAAVYAAAIDMFGGDAERAWRAVPRLSEVHDGRAEHVYY